MRLKGSGSINIFPPRGKKTPKKRGFCVRIVKSKIFIRLLSLQFSRMRRTVRGNKRKDMSTARTMLPAPTEAGTVTRTHREPSETLTHLCKKSICTIFAKCKQFCAKCNYKSTKSTDKTDRRARTVSAFVCPRSKDDKRKTTTRTHAQTGRRWQPSTEPSAAKHGRMLKGKSIRAWQWRPQPITEKGGAGF